MFKEISPALAQRIINEVHDGDKELYRVALHAAAQVGKVRPVFLERQPRPERHRAMSAALGRADLNTIADLQKLTAILEKRGYSADDIAGIMHGNWLRFFGEVLPAN